MGVVTREGQYSWIRYTHQRVNQNKNALYTISGPTGSGKSWSALAICLLNDPDFNVDRVVFSAEELMHLINSGVLRKGSSVMFDEAGVGFNARTWNSITNRVLNYLVQTFRHKNFVLIFTSPYMDFIDSATRKLFHAEFETTRIDHKKKTCSLKPKLLQYNSDKRKFYRKWLRARGNGHGYIPIKRWSVPQPPDDLIKAYEEKKNEFTTALNLRIEQDLKNIKITKQKEYVHTCQNENCKHSWQSDKKIEDLRQCPKCEVRLNPKKKRKENIGAI